MCKDCWADARINGLEKGGTTGGTTFDWGDGTTTKPLDPTGNFDFTTGGFHFGATTGTTGAGGTTGFTFTETATTGFSFGGTGGTTTGGTAWTGTGGTGWTGTGGFHFGAANPSPQPLPQPELPADYKNPDVQAETNRAFQTRQVVRLTLRKSHYVNASADDVDLADWHFRRCETQFIRSCGNAHNNGYGSTLFGGYGGCHGGANFRGANFKKTIREVEYVINPKIIDAYNKKKAEMAKRLGGADNLKIMLAWHGTPRPETMKSITDNGFDMSKIGSGSGDQGYYGRGIYFIEYANVGQGYSGGNRSILLCLVITGKQYNWVGGAQTGCPKKKGYDSHIVRCGGSYGSEIVIFDSAQILPCYIVGY